MPFFPRSIFAVLLGAAFLFAGCGSSDGSNAAESSSDGTTQPASAQGVPHPCELLTAADATDLLGQAATRGEDPRAVAGKACIYETDEKELMLILRHWPDGLDEATFVENAQKNAEFMGAEAEFERLSDLGTVAFWHGGGLPTVTALAGDGQTVTAGFLGSADDAQADRERLEAAVRTLLDRL